MVFEPGRPGPLLLRGEVVEILEKAGQRLARIAVSPCQLLDVPTRGGEEPRLGDAVLIEARITIEGIQSTPAAGRDPWDWRS